MKNFKKNGISIALGLCFAAPAFATVTCGTTDTIASNQNDYALTNNCVVINQGVTVTGDSLGALNGYIPGGNNTPSVINYGTLNGTGGFAVHNHGTIGVFENYGTITGSLHNDAGTIGSLINGQTGMHYDGRLPGSYYTYFSAPSTYGTIAFASGGTLATYGLKIANGQNYATGTYNAVITSGTALTITTQEISGVTYNLSSTDGGRTWNLVIGNVSNTRVATPTGNLGNNPALPAARVIDANSSLLALFAPLTTDTQLSQAASQTLPVLTGATAQVAQTVMSSVNNVIDARQEVNRGESTGDLFYGDKNFWVKPFGTRGTQDDSDGVAGYRANTVGLVFGVDGLLKNNVRVGAAFSYSSTNVNSQISGGGVNGMNIKAYQLIGYGSYDINARDVLDVQADVGQNHNASARNIAFTSSVASASYDTWTAHLGASLNRKYALNERTVLTPSLRVDYTRVQDQGYSETGAGLLDLNVDKHTAEALVFGVDAKLAYQLNDKWTLSANTGVGYDALNKQNVVNSSFAGTAGSSFQTTGIKVSPWTGRGGLGASYKLRSGTDLAARYDTEYRQGYLNQTVSVKLNMLF